MEVARWKRGRPGLHYLKFGKDALFAEVENTGEGYTVKFGHIILKRKVKGFAEAKEKAMHLIDSVIDHAIGDIKELRRHQETEKIFKEIEENMHK